MQIHQIGDVLFTFAISEREDIGKAAKASTGGNAYEIFTWGSKNDLPTFRETMIMDNNIIGEMINTKRSIILGQGLMVYKEIYKDGTKIIEPVEMPAEIADWMEEAEIFDKYLEPAANELFLHANIFASLLPQNGKIAKMMVYKCRYTRAHIRQVNKPIPSYIIGNWDKRQKPTDHIIQAKITAIPNDRAEFIIHTGDKLFHDGYYCHPSYWGGQEWIDLSNQIPKFHKANIANGYSPRFHVQIPRAAFLDQNAYLAARADNNKVAVQKCIDDEQSKKQSFINSMNQLLAGKENSGRAIYSYFELNEEGKKMDGVTIEPIKFDMQDEALLKLFEKSNQANISAQGIHPTLANIESQGKLSSGSEMRNAFEFYVKIKSRLPREIILKPLRHVWKVNGWRERYRDLHLGFEDIVLTSLDDNKSGSEKVANPQMD
jgi:hypothetical protein